MFVEVMLKRCANQFFKVKKFASYPFVRVHVSAVVTVLHFLNVFRLLQLCITILTFQRKATLNEKYVRTLMGVKHKISC